MLTVVAFLALRKAGHTGTIAISSSNDSPDGIIRYLGAGAGAFMNKPASRAELVAAIQRVWYCFISVVARRSHFFSGNVDRSI